MVCLKQAGIITHRGNKTYLLLHGHRPVSLTPVLWKHDIRPTMLMMVVEYFSIKYIEPDDAQHLFSALLH